jgi:hypothetical protein
MNAKNNSAADTPPAVPANLPLVLDTEKNAFALYAAWGIHTIISKSNNGLMSCLLPFGWRLKEIPSLDRKVLYDSKGQRRGSFGYTHSPQFSPASAIQIDTMVSSTGIKGVVYHTSGEILYQTEERKLPAQREMNGYITQEYYSLRSQAIAHLRATCANWANANRPHWNKCLMYW